MTTAVEATAPSNLAEWFEAKGPDLANRLADLGVDPRRMQKLALMAVQGNDRLMACTPASIFMSLMEAAALKLEPSNGHCYFVPYNNRREKTVEARFQLGYRGMIELAQRSGDVGSVYANATHEKDEFDYNLGTDPFVKHKPFAPVATDPTKIDFEEMGPGGLIGFYAVANLTVGGPPAVDFMTVVEVEKIRRKAQSAKASMSPWVTHYEAMGTKTVLRRLLWRGVRLSTEAQSAITVDGAYELGESARLYEVHDQFSDLRDVAEAAGDMADDDEPAASKADRLTAQLSKGSEG